VIKKRKEKILKDFAKISVDLGKLIFAGFVIGQIVKGEVEKSVILASGAIASMLLIFAGVFIGSRFEE